jgi:hypothetical protein
MNVTINDRIQYSILSLRNTTYSVILSNQFLVWYKFLPVNNNFISFQSFDNGKARKIIQNNYRKVLGKYD